MKKVIADRRAPGVRGSRKSVRAGLVGMSLAWALAASPAHAVYILTNGHVDGVEVELENTNELVLHVHVHLPNDSGAPEHNKPDDVFFYVPSNAQTSVPASPLYSFLGSPGNPVWVLPQSTPGTNILFLGMSAEEIDAGTFVGGTITLTLTNFSGPGDFFLWQTDGFGTPTVFMNTKDGLSPADAFVLSEGGHFHMNWGFSATGMYQLGFLATGTLVAGSEFVASEIDTWTFGVETFPIPEPGATWLFSLGVLAMLRSARRRC